ncbi:hypothetical protein OF83DRAFT_1161859 [Amylostereum chailletii]|nr:hypothetical protein OF83DRAFT_1161859 [Amylostereum chailletii]
MSDTLEVAQHYIFVLSYTRPSVSFDLHLLDAIVLWDWIISLPREWYYIWKTQWTPVKATYLFCRYWVIAVVPYLLYAFVMDHSVAACEKMFRIPVALALWNQVGSESVLLIRTYAFFNRNNFVLAGLLCALCGVIAYQLYVATTQMLLLPFVTPPFLEGPCFPMSKPHSAHLLAPLGFDTLVTFMTVWKAFHIRRRNGGPSSRLIQTFLREGVFYYFLISIANLVSVVALVLPPRQVISAINIPLSVMLSPVLACRLILDLRERGSESVAYSDNNVFSQGSRGLPVGIQFSQHHSFTSSGPSPPRSRPTPYASKVTNTGLTLATFGSVSGVAIDSAVELHDIQIDAKDFHEDDNVDITEYRTIELGISGIRVDVEKTSESR